MNRVGQTWTNGQWHYLIFHSHEEGDGVWKHEVVGLEDAEQCQFEESSRIDWSCDDLAYWKRVL